MEKSLFTYPICAAPWSGGGLCLPQRSRLRQGQRGVCPSAARQQKALQGPRRRQGHGGGPPPVSLRGVLRPPAGRPVRPGGGVRPAGEAVLDSGCGEGYYTAGLWEALGRPPLAGIDLSKPSVRLAARRVPEGSSPWPPPTICLWRMPPVGAGAQLLPPWPWTSSGGCSARAGLPLCGARRRPPVGSSSRCSDQPYRNREEGRPHEGFSYRQGGAGGGGGGRGGEALRDLFQMTPIHWKTPRGGGAAGRPGRSAGTGLLPASMCSSAGRGRTLARFMCCAFNCRGGLFCLSEAIHLLPTSARLMPGWRAFHGNPFDTCFLVKPPAGLSERPERGEEPVGKGNFDFPLPSAHPPETTKKGMRFPFLEFLSRPAGGFPTAGAYVVTPPPLRMGWHTLPSWGYINRGPQPPDWPVQGGWGVGAGKSRDPRPDPSFPPLSGKKARATESMTRKQI